VTGAALAAAAEALVGVPFQLNGRAPARGLDCVGLLEAALARIGRTASFPRGYALRNAEITSLVPAPANCGFARVSDAIKPGDVVLFQPGPCQVHVAIAVAAGAFVHAHAGLRRVVVQPGPLTGTLIDQWRLLPNG
jgi:cell wall-associated NlpC family hydrolase